LNETIINSFFELDRRSSLNLHINESHILKEKNLLNYTIHSNFEKIEIVEINKNNHYIVKILKIKK
jgi:hypothetical protein